MKLKIFIFSIISLFSVCILSTYIKKVNASASQSPGLGQCHSLTSPFNSNPGVGWGYSAGIYFNLTKGDGWAAVEKQPGIFDFTLQKEEIIQAKNAGKKIWLELQVASKNNKEHNVPKWAIDSGVETGVFSLCGNDFLKYEWSTIEPYWNNPDLIDQSEAIRYVENSKEYVKLPKKIAAVWDPKFQQYYLKAVKALRDEFQNDIQNGTIEAFNIHSGGNFGEHYIVADCDFWEKDCLPDIINPDCPVIQSMGRIKGKTPQYIASRSNCDPRNIIPGNDPILCDSLNCPTENGRACYVFDDYYIQALKELISKEIEIFNSGGTNLPLVWQDGSGLSHSGRTNTILKKWMNNTYGSRIWFKWNGWGPNHVKNNTMGFNIFGTTTKHGYEPVAPYSSSRTYFKKTANSQLWCDEMATQKPPECSHTPLNGEEIGRIAIAQAIRKGILEDKSSFLCMQNSYFDTNSLQTRTNGKLGNEYYFNPNDNTQNCVNSEINVSAYGVGFCPGYLNYVFSQADAPVPPPPVPTSYPNPTITPNPNTTLTPTPTGSIPLSCTSCSSGKITKNRGNANCDNTVNNDDYLLWEDIFKKIVNNTFVSEEDKGKVDFDCSNTDKTHRIDLVDFEIWRRYAY